MTSEFVLYNNFRENIAKGIVDLAGDTIKLALVTSDYMPDAAHSGLADAMASPSPEVPEGGSPDSGYDTGGAMLTGSTVTHDNAVATWDAENVSWASLNATFRYGILYAQKSVGAIVNPLIGYIIFDNTPGDIVKVGETMEVVWAPTGILTLS